MKHEVSVAEDRIHFPWPGPDWLESFWFGFYDSVQKVGLVTLLGFNAKGERSRLWLLMVENGETVLDETDLYLPLEDQVADEIRAGNMKVEILEDSKAYRLTYESEDASLDVVWTGSTPVKSTTGGRPFPGQRDIEPRGHSEQAGRVTGTIAIRGNEYRVEDVQGWRDHLWGHAISDGWTEMGWWCWLTGTVDGAGISFNVSAHRFVDGREGFYGFVFKDDAIRRIFVESCEITKDESGRHPLSCKAVWTDQEDGSRYELEGEVIAPLWVEEPVPDGVCVINDAPSRFTLNGHEGYGTIEMGDVYRDS